MRVRADGGVRGVREIVPVEGRARSEPAGTEDGARCRVRHGAVAAGELDDPASIEEHVVRAEVEVGECAGRLGEKLKDSQLTANDVATDTESTSVEAP